MTSRRVKKGPGRRPLSQQRARYVALRAQGMSIRRAGREVGVSRTTANNWDRGYWRYRGTKKVEWVPPLDRLEVKEVSPRYLSQDERLEIADLHRQGRSIRQIARQLGRAPSTISRELRRNTSARRSKPVYNPFEAHRRAVARRARPRERRILADYRLKSAVQELLDRRWSPSQIARRLRRDYPTDRRMWVCHESIYQAIYQPGSGLTCRFTVPSAARGPLRTGRTGRRAQRREGQRRPRFEQPMLTIHDRPFELEDRSQWGHWEGDLIVGTQGREAIATMVERRSRLTILVHLPATDSVTVTGAICKALSGLPASLVTSLTWDQGTEMARHLSVTAALAIPVYFCDPHAPWQRGSNENTNGLLRQYFPKGTNLAVHSAEHLAAVADELNDRPRAVLDDRSPLEFISDELGLETSKRCVVG